MIGRSHDNHVVAVWFPRAVGRTVEVDCSLLEGSFVASISTSAPNVVLAPGSFPLAASLLLLLS